MRNGEAGSISSDRALADLLLEAACHDAWPLKHKRGWAPRALDRQCKRAHSCARTDHFLGHRERAVVSSQGSNPVGRGVDLIVKFDPRAGSEFGRMADLPIDTPNGAVVPIRSLADVRREQGPRMVLRENVQQRIVIACNVAGRDLGSVVNEIRQAVSRTVPMPAGYRVEYGGQFESERSASQRLLALGVLAIAGVFMLLVLALGRARDALIVMVNLPLALIGGVVGVFLAGEVLNAATMIGFITLSGTAARSGIMLVTHIHHLMNVEGVRDFREAVERGAKERLVPILMTAAAAGLALIPLAVVTLTLVSGTTLASRQAANPRTTTRRPCSQSLNEEPLSDHDGAVQHVHAAGERDVS
jgi:disulfide bond formation protein DsbB